jgi:hypothetical protein
MHLYSYLIIDTRQINIGKEKSNNTFGLGQTEEFHSKLDSHVI